MIPGGNGHIRLLCVIGVCLFVVACGSSGPARPEPGTPAFNWLVAKDAYKAGDYNKATEILIRLTERTNEFTDQARPWAMTLSLAMTTAYLELADKYDEGGKRNRTTPGPFRKVASEYKTRAAATAMQYLELAHKFTTVNKDKDVKLVFELPQAGLEDPVQYKKITIGQLIQDSERLAVEKEVIKRDMLRSVLRALNTPKDLAKGRAMYQNGEATAPGQSFLFMMAKGLYDASEVFGPKKQDQPQRVKVMYTEALEALGMIKDSKEAKDLTKKITDAQKKLKVS
jgi:hypothetical protein